MGFEQLAALKAKLTEQAKNEARAKAPRPSRRPPLARDAKDARAAQDGQNARDARDVKGGSGGKRTKPAGAQGNAPKAAKPGAPVDPVVRTFGKLQKRFPIAFPKNPAPKVPLKIGIFEDVLAHATELGLTEAELRDAIRTWCRGARYWACLTVGAQRVDLDGQPVGAVTEADARRSKQLLSGRPKQGPAKGKAKAPAKSAAAEPATAATPPVEPSQPEPAQPESSGDA
jgi:ProP effector